MPMGWKTSSGTLQLIAWWSYTVTAKASDHETLMAWAQVFYVDAQGQNKFVKKAFIDFKINLSNC